MPRLEKRKVTKRPVCNSYAGVHKSQLTSHILAGNGSEPSRYQIACLALELKVVIE
jgi:hypothetical protein